jgi:hypothetical protein
MPAINAMICTSDYSLYPGLLSWFWGVIEAMKSSSRNRIWGVALTLTALSAMTVLNAQFALAEQKYRVSMRQSTPIIREQNGFTVTAKIVNAEKPTLEVRVLRDTRPYAGIVHTYFVSKDFKKLYFQYPEQIQRGSYELELPAMIAGTYDLILEITGGGGHEHDNPAFVQVFPIGLELIKDTGDTAWLKRLSLKPGALELQAAGKSSKFEWNTLLDAQPVAWGDYDVHQFILATDWSYFKHNHPSGNKLGLGSVSSSFTFPKAGPYAMFVYLEAGVRVDKTIRFPTLTYPELVNIP